MILLAGGIGSRTKLKVPKQYHMVNDDLIINFLLKNIIQEIDKIIIVCDPKYQDDIYKSEKIIFTNNGQTRLESLKNGYKKMKEIAKDNNLIFIHEAARIFLDKRDIDLHKKNAKQGQGQVTCNIVFDTMFKIDKDNFIKEVIKKQEILAGYNPQSYFWKDLIKYEDQILSEKEDLDLTDILLSKGFKIKTLNQISNLRKVTTFEDVLWIEEELNDK